MASNKISLARPGNDEARKALTAYRKGGDDLILSATTMFLCMGIAWSAIANGIARVIIVIVVAAYGALLAAIGIRSSRRKAAYLRYVETGDIITVDSHFLDVWDQLRDEQGVTLTGNEREDQIRQLFSAAEDVIPDLTVRAQCLDEPELADRLLTAEARIRARLAREVTALCQQLEDRRKLDQLALNATDWATEEEVNAQLDILRGRKLTQTTDDTEQGSAQ